MTRHSLRLRLIAGGAAAILIALSLAGVALTILFERHVTRTIVDDLDVHLKQLLAGITIGADGHLEVAQPPVDPRFADPLSGLYWQVSDDRGQLLRSRSLWDTTLLAPMDDIGPGAEHHHQIGGPGGARLMMVERQVSLSNGGQALPIRAAVAVDLARVSAAGMAFARDLMVALGVLGLVLALATSVQVMLGLRPLGALLHGIADIRSGRNRRLPTAVPSEVLPLVEEVNALLAAQEQEIERSRGRAADLAHGLKTPLAALASDAGRLRERGETRLAQDIEAVGEAMSRHVDRELARARLRGATRGEIVPVALAPLARSLVTILSRTPAGQHIDFAIQVDDTLSLPLDRSDLAEVLGNLLDNATRHAKARVRISAGHGAGGAFVCIEDDGCGVAPAARDAVLGRGIRLDQRGGAGLGLSIVQDVLEAYGWSLRLTDSELGGLKACCGPAD
ncbi:MULTISPECIES: HAMP domain-containing sensor histidine kinase [Rhodopseudomonas]|uniref:histidine kinase n=1 Tax=Rhodopseudomonas palustris TaxID=1076 RepID=A0A0D7F2D7_RHOPL|nr:MULTISPECIES: HAMP domain-containing sensor histidine kinase [Rhodopseudomonas]KIZ45877.1 histidine kinase [Rhodopseudomonas palustris]MDF3813902.1 HAMP domain-containing sensor histidine kinase [Rhodopseudomonas sp. BAL398]WOK16164.1 HAMP domain-containing sensor histidine kinase [Rhodopseudomonas sp. BAL398]